jgi:type I restriction enzyme R subunit
MTPEERARAHIDNLLALCGWAVHDRDEINLSGAAGVAVREVSLQRGHGEVDYLLFAEGKAIGTIEAKPEGWTLRGVEAQSSKYLSGLPDIFPTWGKPLPFAYESTGTETRFTNFLEPEARSREVFAFHSPQMLVEWAKSASSLPERLRQLPPFSPNGLWPAQLKAITNLERSLAENRPRAVIQMATGSGKTFTAVNIAYRLIRYAGARRILFLVDRANLGRQALKEFQQYRPPDDSRLFAELYNIQLLQANQLDPVSRVCITTIQRLYSMLKGEAELTPELEEVSTFTTPEVLTKEALPVAYNPALPIETFDFIIVDECHRSIYNLWRQVLEYFDAYLLGLTATPSKQTFGFFHQNLVMEYNHEQAVADGVNVNYDVYRIRTEITEKGSKVKAGFFVGKRNRFTRRKHWQQLDEDLAYSAQQLDRDVVAPDQLRTVIRTFRDKLFTEIFPGRTEVPKTLIYAKDDAHADEIVEVVRQEFVKGNEFCRKITYKTTGAKPEELISAFRNNYYPRVVVTVDMIATGTDIKPLEIVLFMRSVRSRTFFEQMKGRGVRVISESEFRSVTPDASDKTHFIIVDAVGVCESDKTDSRPLERKRSVSFEKLLEAISFGNRHEPVLTSLAGRLARLDRQLNDEEREELKTLANGLTVKEITGRLLAAFNPDNVLEQAQRTYGVVEPAPAQRKEIETKLADEAAHIIAANPRLRKRLIEIKKENEQVIDTVSQDRVLAAGFDEQALTAARSVVESFEQFIADNSEEITALQVLYSQPHRRRLEFSDLKELAAAIRRPPHRLTTDNLWRAYETLDKSSVRGTGKQRLMTDLVSLIKFALREEHVLQPFADEVQTRFENWLARQETLHQPFTQEQRRWLEMISEHIATSLTIETEDFKYSPFSQRGGLGRAYTVFGDDLPKLLEELNEVLAA